MKIGILTFHLAHNYGAVLQCYALQEALRQLGHEVRVINYRQPYIKGIYGIFNVRYFFSLLGHLRLKTLLYYLKHLGRRVKRTRLYHSFRHTYWQETPSCSSRNIPPMDAYVIGSDQVWSLHCTQFMDQVYWGQFSRPRQSRIIGYAISATLDSLSQIGEKEIRPGRNLPPDRHPGRSGIGPDLVATISLLGQTAGREQAGSGGSLFDGFQVRLGKAGGGLCKNQPTGSCFRLWNHGFVRQYMLSFRFRFLFQVCQICCHQFLPWGGFCPEF